MQQQPLLVMSVVADATGQEASIHALEHKDTHIDLDDSRQPCSHSVITLRGVRASMMGAAFGMGPDLACNLIESSLSFLINDTSLLKLLHGVIKQPLVEVSSLLGITCTSYMQDEAVIFVGMGAMGDLIGALFSKVNVKSAGRNFAA